MAEGKIATRRELWQKIEVLRKEKDALGDLLKDAQVRLFMADGSSHLYERISKTLKDMDL